MTKTPKSSSSWFLSALPFNIAYGPLSTFIQLILLQSYGQTTGTVYVGLVTTIYNGITIPAAMLWGFATDRVRERRVLIALSFVLDGAELAVILASHSVFAVGFVYGAFALVGSTAATTPYNLLIIETHPKNKWASAFATFSMISTLGDVIGLLLSFVWVAFLPLIWLAVPLSVLCLLSAALAALFIKEPPLFSEREAAALQQRQGRFQRFLELRRDLPKLADFKGVFKGLRGKLTRQTPILYLSIGSFNVASGLFNTSLTPSMTRNDLSNSEVYVIYLVAMVIQVLAFRYAGRLVSNRRLARTAGSGLILRSICYAAMAVSVLFVSGIWYIIPSIIFYPIAAGVAYTIYYTSSSTMVFNSLDSSKEGEGRHGFSLGIYSAIVGVALMSGSLVSGFISVYLGYYITFLVAALFLVFAAALTSKLNRFEVRKPEV